MPVFFAKEQHVLIQLGSEIVARGNATGFSVDSWISESIRKDRCY